MIVKCLTGMGQVSAQCVGFWVSRAIFSVGMFGGSTRDPSSHFFLRAVPSKLPAAGPDTPVSLGLTTLSLVRFWLMCMSVLQVWVSAGFPGTTLRMWVGAGTSTTVSALKQIAISPAQLLPSPLVTVKGTRCERRKGDSACSPLSSSTPSGWSGAEIQETHQFSLASWGFGGGWVERRVLPNVAKPHLFGGRKDC